MRAKSRIRSSSPEAKLKKSESDKQYVERNRDKVLEKKRKYYADNKEVLSEKAKERYLANPEPTRNRTKTWKENNRGRHNSNCMKRHSSKLKATPVWLDELMLLYIDEVYDKCQRISLLTNIEHHVDHIVPLKGKLVCGLHVPWNLQILSASENCSKRNTLTEDATNAESWVL